MSRSTQRIIAALIGIVFLVAGILKALNPAAFAVDILNYRLLPWTWDVVVALYLPWLEILCGAALLFRVAYRGALLIAAALFATFVIAYGSTRPRGLDVACGCFGHGVHRGYWPLLITDSLMLAIVLWLLKSELSPLSPVIRAGAPTSPA
jgi:putative oxidoreductase